MKKFWIMILLIIFTAVVINNIVHETIHVIQAKINKEKVSDICFLGYSEDGSKIGWVAVYSKDSKEVSFAKQEIVPVMAGFITAILITIFLTKQLYLFENEKERQFNK